MALSPTIVPYYSATGSTELAPTLPPWAPHQVFGSLPCQQPPGSGGRLNARIPTGVLKPRQEKYLFFRVRPAGVSVSGGNPVVGKLRWLPY